MHQKQVAQPVAEKGGSTVPLEPRILVVVGEEGPRLAERLAALLGDAGWACTVADPPSAHSLPAPIADSVAAVVSLDPRNLVIGGLRVETPFLAAVNEAPASLSWQSPAGRDVPLFAFDEIPRALATALAPPLEADRRVRIAGTVESLSKGSEALLRAAARAVAGADAGLVAGRHTGVDRVARLAYFRARALAGKPIACEVLGGLEDGVLYPLPGEVVRRTLDDYVELGDVLFVFPGGRGTEALFQEARAARVPVLALARAGGKATEVHAAVLADWETRPVAGLTKPEYEQLAGDVNPGRLTEMLGSVLDAAVRGFAHSAQRAILANDLSAGEDLLGVERQARVFAEVIAARDLKPPLAIGLFGEWGAGKSFFMDRIADEVDSLAIDQADPHSLYCHRVCQVRFNAWHYMDSHLWASLAGRVFDGLAQHLGPGDADPAARRKELRRRLESSREESERATAVQEAADKQLREAQGTVARLELRREQELRSFRALFDRQVRRIVVEQLEAEAADAPDSPEARALADVGAAIDTLAMPGVTAEVLAGREEARAILDRARSLAGRVHGLLKAVTPVGVWWIVPIVLVALPFLVAPLLEVAVGLDRAFAQRMLPAGELLAFGFWVLKKGRDQLDALDRLVVGAETLERRAERTRAALLADPTAEQKEALQLRAAAEGALVDARRRAADAETMLSRTEAQLAELEAGRLVYDFVADRAGNGSDYRRRQGIVSVVRRDLEELKALLDGWREEPGFSGHGVDRIVLYIDDLDRCPAEQVVDVLQAVHLLLAFELFVVVVGVDARWLERALKVRYPTMLGGHGDGLHHEAASAHDYLEKIFQVPYTLPDMQRPGFEDLLGALLPVEGEIVLPPPEDPGALDTQELVMDLDLDAEVAPAPDDDVELQSVDEPGPAMLELELDAEPEPDDVELVEAPRTVALEAHEQIAARALHGFLPTPRLTKRFANIYRLLRVSVSEAEYASFIRPGDGEHRAVQVLLALNSGFPRLGSDLLLRLAKGEDLGARWSDAVDRIAEGPDPHGERAHAVELLRAVPDLPQDLAPYRRWAGRVGRFSFYWRG